MASSKEKNTNYKTHIIFPKETLFTFTILYKK